MLMKYTWCIPLCILYIWQGAQHLSDNSTEFKSKLFVQVAFTLIIKQVFSSPYYP